MLSRGKGRDASCLQAEELLKVVSVDVRLRVSTERSSRCRAYPPARVIVAEFEPLGRPNTPHIS
eukprot:2045087-Pleurochrysis_carterae.AAC.4